MAELTLTVIGLPAPQGSKKGFYNRTTGRVQMVESSKKVKPWRQDVKAAALNEIAATGSTVGGWEQLVGPVHLAITFYLPRPGYHYRTGQHAGELKPNAPVYVDKKPDLSKLIRSTEDALTEAGVYRDDAQVTELAVVKKYAGGRWTELTTPGAMITVTSMAPVPGAAPVAAMSTAQPSDGVLFS